MRTLSALVICFAILSLAGHSYAQTELVSDNFTGSNGTYLGSNWTGCGYNYGAYTKLVYENGSAGGSGYWSQDCALYTGYGAFPSDQYATATIVAPTPSSTKQASVELRGNATPKSNEAYIACGWDAQDFPADYHYRIWSLTPGAPGPVSLWLSKITPATNDVISCQVLGNTVTMKLNGKLVQSVTDTSGINSGYPGLYYIDPNGTGPSSSDIIFANFQAGSGPAVVSTTITPENVAVPAGFFVQFSGTITYADGSVATTNSWSSSNNSVATVDITGTAYGVSQGTAMLTGSSGPDGVTATMNVEAPNGYTPLVYDTFVGGDGLYLGSNWAGCSYDGGIYSELVYENNQAGGSGYWSQDCSLYIGYGTFPNDQYATAMVVDPVPSSTTEASLELRSSATSGTPERSIACGWDAQDFPSDQHYRIWSLAPRGTPVTLFLSTITPKTNDVIWCQVLGSEVTMLVNGTMIAVVNDTSGVASGYPGMFYIDPYGNPPQPNDVIFDNFGAGQIDNAVAASITVSPSSSTITGNSTQQYTATGTFTDGTVSNITTSSSWTSSNTLIATVNSSGLATGVGPGTVTITATDGTASGTASLTVKYLTPTVTFTGAPASAAYNTSFTVTATTNASTMPQITGTSGVCTVSTVSGTPASASALVTMTSGTGICTLTATWAADSKYISPTPLTQNTSAIKATATLSLTTTSISVPYGSTIPNIQTDYTLTGFVGTDTQASVCTGSPILSTTATNTSPVGTYPITALIGTLSCPSTNATYTVTIVNSGNVNITKVTGSALTLTTTNGTGTYGTTPIVSGDYTLTGFLGSDTQGAACTGSPSVTTTATNTSPVGTYPITGAIGTLVCSSANATYTVSFVNTGIYTVTKASGTLTLTTTSISIPYLTTVPSVANDYTLTGFLGGDTQGMVCAGLPTLTTTATNTSLVGAYPITAVLNGLTCSSANATYSINIVNSGNVNITQATTTISWSPATIIYGQGLTAAQLNAQAVVGANNVSADGSFAYTYLGNPITTGTVLPFGNDTICVVFTPSAGYSTDLTTSAQLCTTESVTAAPLTITATPNATAVYNTPLPNSTFTYTVTGWINPNDQALCTGSVVLSTQATQGSSVGIYTINVGGTYSCPGYNLVVNTGELHITPATLTIIPVAVSLPYGSQVPAYSYNCYFGTTLEGTNNCGSYAITGTPTITTTATNRASGTPGVVYYTSNVGTYALNSTWGSLKSPSGNYTFAFSPSTLTLTTSAQSLTVQPNNITVKLATCQSSGLPTLTYKITGLINWDTQASTTTGTPTLSVPSYGGTCAKGTYQIQSSAGTLTLDQYSGQTDYSGINYGTSTLTIN